MKIKMKVKDSKEFERDLVKFAKKTRTDIHGAFLKLAGSSGIALAEMTHPFGLTKKVEKRIKLGVKLDVNRVYLPKSHVNRRIKEIDKRKAAGFMKAMRLGDIEAAERIARSTINATVGKDNGEFLQTQRTRRGRVPRGNDFITGMTSPEINAIIKEGYKTVGTAKAGWYSAIGDLKTKTKKPLKWLSKDKSLGRGRSKKRRNKSIITLENRVKYIRDNLPKSKVNSALSFAKKNFFKRVQKTVEKRIAKA